MISKTKCILDLLPLYKPRDRIRKPANSASVEFIETNVNARKLTGVMKKDNDLVLVCTTNRTERAIGERSKTRITAGCKSCVRELFRHTSNCGHPVDAPAADSTATFVELTGKCRDIIELKEEKCGQSR